LKFFDSKSSVRATQNAEMILVRFKYLSGSISEVVRLLWHRAPNGQSSIFESCERVGPRLKPTHASFDCVSVHLPVDQSVFTFEHGSEGSFFMFLWLRFNAAEIVQRLAD